MKHISFIAAGLSGGGIEKAYSSLANHLVNIGYKVTVILLFKTNHFFTLDKRIELVEPTLERATMHRLVYAMRIIPYLRRTIKKMSPDTMLSYGEWFNPFVILATRGLKIPLYVSDRMSPTLKLGIMQDTAKKILYKYSEGVIAQTQYAKEIIQQKTNHRNIKVVPNPINKIDVEDYNPLNQIVTVGRLSREKGHKFLIDAFSKIKNKKWSLHLVGDGDERDKLELQVNRLGIANVVIFHGHQKEFKSILASSDIFVLPSLSEGFPNALIEAMSVPLACISSDCIAGPSDIIEHGVNGLLVPPGDSEALADSINSLIIDTQMRERIRHEGYKIRERLEFSKVANEILKFIQIVQ